MIVFATAIRLLLYTKLSRRWVSQNETVERFGGPHSGCCEGGEISPVVLLADLKLR